MKTTYLMNPHTGSVDTKDSWLSENDTTAGLIEVQLADGSEVPADFQPCDSGQYDWVEVE